MNSPAVRPERSTHQPTMDHDLDPAAQDTQATFIDDAPSSAGLRQRLVESHGDQPVAVLGRLGTRARNAIERMKLTTVAELIERLDADPDSARAEFGKKTHAELLSHLDDAARVGVTQLVFGQPSVPKTAHDLFVAWLRCHEEPREREMAFLRYASGLTLQQVADKQVPKVTRERVRQIVDRNLTCDRPAWGDVATSILDPVEALLERCGGIAPLSHALVLSGATTASELEFASELASEMPRIVVVTVDGTSLVSRLSVSDTHELCRELWRELDSALARGSRLSNAQEVLTEFGIRLDKPLELELLRDCFKVDVQGEAAYSNRRWAQSVWVNELRLAAGPASVEAIVRSVKEKHPGVPATPHNAATHFMRSPDVFHLGKAGWIHADHLPVDRETLANIAQACLADLPRHEKASSVKHVLQRVGASIPAALELNPYVVRDAMTKTGRVRGWRNSLDVAWKDLEYSRLNLEQRIRLSALALDQPFHISELIAEVAALGGAKEESVLNKVTQAVDLLAFGGGEYMVREHVFPELPALEAEVERVAAIVPADRVITVAGLAAKAKVGAPREGLYKDQRMAWALARRTDTLETRRLGGLVWRKAYASTAWEALSKEPSFSLGPQFKASEFVSWVAREHGVADSAAYVFLQEAVEAGLVERNAGSYRRVTGA